MCVCARACVQITKVYVTSRLESVEEVLRDHLDNPLDDQTHVLQQLDQMSVIARQVHSVRATGHARSIPALQGS